MKLAMSVDVAKRLAKKIRAHVDEYGWNDPERKSPPLREPVFFARTPSLSRLQDAIARACGWDSFATLAERAPRSTGGAKMEWDDRIVREFAENLLIELSLLGSPEDVDAVTLDYSQQWYFGPFVAYAVTNYMPWKTKAEAEREAKKKQSLG